MRSIILVAAIALIVPSVAGAAPAECTIVGTSGPDRLVGTAGDDVICGLGGDDRISGLAGDDILRGGPGNDVIAGGSGDDRLYGNAGGDRLRGGKGDDRLYGGGGNDRLYGGNGDDWLQGNRGDDYLNGGRGVDTMYGGPGINTFVAGEKGDGDRTPPDTTVSGGPPAETEATSATFSLSASEDPVTFECSLDGAAFEACGQEVAYTGLAVGQHTFQARATDLAGNTDPTPASRAWAVQPPPEPVFWLDGQGDSSPNSPNISKVLIGDDGAGTLTVRVETFNFEHITDTTRIQILFDIDQDPTTGDTRQTETVEGRGEEYSVSIDGWDETANLNWWNEATSEWEWVKDWRLAEWEYGVTVPIDLAEIGSPSAVSLWVFSSGGLGEEYEPTDKAPETGTWAYEIGSAPALPVGEPRPPQFFTLFGFSEDTRTQGWIDMIDGVGWLEEAVEALNETYVLPDDVYVYIWESELGPHYNPADRSIALPPWFLGASIRVMRNTYGGFGSEEELAGRALQAFSWVFLHEAGHALIDLFGLPVTGLEEDAADQFATVFAIENLDGGQWDAYNGALLFRAIGNNRGAPEIADYWDEHALHEQRDTNILCWLYGYDPFEFVFVPARFPEAQNRLGRCGLEYQQMVESWQRLLAPHAKETTPAA